MKIIYWNIRGIGNNDSRIAFREMYRLNNPSLVFLAEPMVVYDSIPSWFWNNLHVTNYCVNKREPLIPNLWAVWGADVAFTVTFASSQCLVLEHVCNGSTVYIAGIYASTSYILRRQLWADLTRLQNTLVAPWLFVGDFNAVLGAHDKRGRRLPPSLSCTDFLTWTNANLLMHMNTNGVQYTWNNGRLDSDSVFQRLDRAICNEAWIDFWRGTSCTTLMRTQSDHHPLLVCMTLNLTPRTTSFKFFKTWTQHEDCRPLVLATWKKEVIGAGMHCLQTKLHRLKDAFRVWNKTVFGDVQRQVQLAADEVSHIQNLIDSSGLDTDTHSLELQAQLSLTLALNIQDQFWREKARNQSFIYGDRNTAYFHRMASIKSSAKVITFIQDGETRITKSRLMEEHVVSYFQNIFGGNNNCVNNGLAATVIPFMVTEEENAMLAAMPMFDEIKDAVFTMNADGAPGPDGFGGHFYQHFWDIVSADLVSSVQEFFYTGVLIPNINSNILVLIPKVPGAATMGDFRPIALANFQFKIVTKILADRLALICMRIISPEQRGFVRDRKISDCIIMASEAINMLTNSAKPSTRLTGIF